MTITETSTNGDQAQTETETETPTEEWVRPRNPEWVDISQLPNGVGTYQYHDLDNGCEIRQLDRYGVSVRTFTLLDHLDYWTYDHSMRIEQTGQRSLQLYAMRDMHWAKLELEHLRTAVAPYELPTDWVELTTDIEGTGWFYRVNPDGRHQVETRSGTTTIRTYTRRETDQRWTYDDGYERACNAIRHELINTMVALYERNQTPTPAVALANVERLEAELVTLQGTLERTVQEHRDWKINATRIAHDYANRNNYCGEFDQVMREIGLPGRNSSWDVTVMVQIPITVRIPAGNEETAQERVTNEHVVNSIRNLSSRQLSNTIEEWEAGDAELVDPV